MIEVMRKRGESFESMMRRFKRRVQRSGRIREAKRVRFHADPKNKTALKRSALRRLELRRHFDKLKKLGKLPEEDTRGFRRRQ